MQHITVAYATMPDYYYYISVSMISILRTARQDTFVDFVVLHGTDFTKQGQDELKRIIAKHGQHSLTFINVDQYIFSESHIQHIAKATYYRLVLAEVLDVDRCLYLDGDTIICQDLQELYNTDLTGYYLAGVRGPAYYNPEFAQNPVNSRQSLLPDFSHYVNAGVLLMNLALIRERGLTLEFLRRMALNLPTQDQDVLNGVCYEAIKFLPFKYNMMTKYRDYSFEKYYGCFTREQILEAWNAPVIIHYADRLKPWNTPRLPLGDLWWRVCETETELFTYFLTQASRYLMYEAVYAHVKQPLFLDLAYSPALMLWGAGEIAQQLVAKLQAKHIKPQCCIVSNGYHQYNASQIMGVPVREIGELSQNVSEVTLLLAVKEQFRQDAFFKAKEKGFQRIICEPELL